MYTLITGASSGIGYELAKVCGENGQNLILVARSQGALEKLALEIREKFKVQVEVLPVDLSKPGASESLFRHLQDKKWDIQILVNNAGFGDYGPFLTSELSKLTEMIQVNISALTELTHFILPTMKQRGSGRIMNVASTAAFQPGPLMAVYYATKSYVLSFTEALAEELRDSGITATALCPGPTISGFQEKANLNNVLLLKMTQLPTSKDVAVYGFRAMMKGQVVAVHGVLNNIATSSLRITPRSLVVKLVRRLQETRSENKN